MDIRRWSCSGKEVIRLGRSAKEDDISLLRVKGCCNSNKRAWWRAVWKTLVRERAIFGRRVQVRRRIRDQPYCYDAYSYAKNFDEGGLWDEGELDNMSRSFSMRFADPSKVHFLKRDVRLLDL